MSEKNLDKNTLEKIADDVKTIRTITVIYFVATILLILMALIIPFQQ